MRYLPPMMKNDSIYLDCNATTPCAPEVLDAMVPFFTTAFGNPASTHVMGRAAARAVETARQRVAATTAWTDICPMQLGK
jgi:cysteine sulfinate desulfinase/cysteine desulfurase-like protein